MQLKKQCLFALILISFISCDLLFDKDMQEKSAGLLDKVHSILDARNQAISNTSDKPSKLIKRSLKKIRTKRKQGTERGKVNTQELPLDNGPIAGVYAPSVNDVLVSDYMTQEILPEEERENLPVVIVSGSDSTSLNNQEKESKPELTIPTVSLSGTTGNLSDLSSGGYSGNYEYTYYSIPTTISGSASSIIEEEDSPQYEYYDQLEEAEKTVDSALKLIQKIKGDRDQVELQSTIRMDSRYSSEKKTVSLAKMEQFTKEKLAQILKELLKEVDDTRTAIDNAVENSYEPVPHTSVSYTTYADQNLYLAQGKLYDLIQAVEKVSSTYDAYAKSTGIGRGSDFSQVETILKEVKELLGKAKNEISLTFKN
ncbi:hypothetical protein [Borrelia turicatae]|nr:hypothetical protein [Borrelia turicatae]AGR55594.1 fibronectin-binding protein C [Borrelia turicatae]UPA13929.1 hypothetical protein bt91E135_001090 [Borrelia turicatae 91E135]